MSHQQPLVSILMPCYARPYLMANRSIPSVLAQKYERWELIVVSDGIGNCRVRRVVESFDDKRIRYFEIQRPDYSGLSDSELWHAAGAAARNFAESHASGDIIALLDDDDTFEPHHLGDCLDALVATGADLVYGNVHLIDVNIGVPAGKDYFPWRENDSRRRFVERNIIRTPSVAYTSKWREIPYPTGGEIAADFGKWLAMHAAGATFASIDQVQATHFLSPTKISMPSLPPLSECLTAVTEIHRTRQVSNHGPHCQELEERVATRLGVDHVVAASSGDTALGMAMLVVAERDRQRDEVIVPSYTFPSTVNAIVRAGLKPVFCDVEPGSLGVTVDTARSCSSSATAAIFPVHTHGIPCDMPGLEKLAADLDVLLVSDAAAAFGAVIDDRQVGTFGDIEIFSLSATKVLTAGEGGLLACRDDSIAVALRELGRYGLGDNYSCTHVGGANGRMSEFSAALALAGLPLLDEWLDRRRVSAELYRRGLHGSGLVMIQPTDSNHQPTWKDIAFLTPTAETSSQLQRRLADYRIETRPYYRALHRMTPFTGYARGNLAVTDDIADRVLCLPITNEIPLDTIRFVTGTTAYELESLHQAGHS